VIQKEVESEECHCRASRSRGPPSKLGIDSYPLKIPAPLDLETEVGRDFLLSLACRAG